MARLLTQVKSFLASLVRVRRMKLIYLSLVRIRRTKVLPYLLIVQSEKGEGVDKPGCGKD